MRSIGVAILALMIALPALAQDADDALLKDYIGLTKLLRSHGVDPVGINWVAIEQSCLGLDSETDHVTYNRCRFQKAIDVADYPGDRNACVTKAQAEFPDSLMNSQAVLTIAKKDGSSSFFQQPLSYAEVSSKRDAAFDDCMSGKGWRDTGNPTRGRVRSE